MADYRSTQPTFTGGEVSEDLYGRKDLARYQTSTKRMENIIVQPAGGAMNRNGLAYLGNVPIEGGNKLTRFEAAGDDAFLLIWGNNNVRFAANGGFVEDGGAPYQVATDIPAWQLRDLYMDQSNDVATLTHPSYPVKELRRYAATDWRFSYVSWSPDIPPPTGVTATTTEGYTDYDESHLPLNYEYRVAAVTDSGQESLPSEIAVTNAPLVFGYSKNFVTITWGGQSGNQRIGSGASGSNRKSGTRVDLGYKIPNGKVVYDVEYYCPDSSSGSYIYIGTVSGNTYTIVVSEAFNHRGGGWQRLTLPTPFEVPATGDYHIGVWSGAGDSIPTINGSGLFQSGGGQGTQTMTPDNSPYPTAAWIGDIPTPSPVGIKEYIVYKGKNGIFGAIGRTPNTSFKDDNIAADFTNGPQDGYSPFDNGNYPAINFFAEQRRGFARSVQQPQTIWMTQSADFDSMRSHTPTRDSDAIEFTLAATKKQDIFHVLAKERGLLVFTRSGEWTVTGRDGDILTPSSQLPNPQSYYGAAQYLRPMIIGNSILFVQRDYKTVLEMEYSFEVDSYQAEDKTLLAKHLFEGKSIVAWDYAHRPHDVIWCVMSDGTDLTLTYMKDQDVWGWSRHWTLGKFVDVCVIPEINGDIPYFLIDRINASGPVRCVEFLPPRESGDIRDARFLDSFVSYDNPMNYSGIIPAQWSLIDYTGTGVTEGDEIEISGSSVTDIDGNFVLSFDGRYTLERDPRVASRFYLIHAENGESDDGLESWSVGDYVDFTKMNDWPRPVTSIVNGVIRRCVGRITSGLEHLEGCKVTALCDGLVYDTTFDGSPLIVSGGGLPEFEPELKEKFARIHVGLPYRSVLHTLDFLNTQADDNGVKKTTGSVYVRVKQTRGMKFAVDTEDDIFEAIPAREDETYYEPPKLIDGVKELQGTNGWEEEHSLIFIQDYPLPMTILGITNENFYGDP